MTDSVHKVLQHYGVEGRIEPLGNGHIHDTFSVTSDAEAIKVLQRVNEFVFKDGDLVMNQTRRVLTRWAQQDEFIVPALIKTSDGYDSVRVDGELWRMWKYLPDTQVIDPLRDPNQVYLAARAFACFQKSMRDLGGPGLHDTIAGFLDYSHYLEAYTAVRGLAPQKLDQLIQTAAAMSEALSERNAVIHGDCKVNNVLFDQAGTRVVALIDFDTVMHGHWSWDYGDLVRSVCFSAGGYSPELYAACVRGFVGSLGGGLRGKTSDDEALVDAPAFLSVMLGM